MKKSIMYVALCAILLTVMASCQKNPHPGYQKNENGLYYRFYTEGTGETPAVNEVLDVNLACYVNDTTTIIPPMKNMTLWEESMFKGDLFEGLALMHKGDSASFIVNIDSAFRHFFNQPSLPKEFSSEDVMRFDVLLNDFYSEEVYNNNMAEKVKKEAEDRARKLKEAYPTETENAAKELEKYLIKNKVVAEPLPSGLVYVMTSEGNGEKPMAGQDVSVHYTGKLLNGKVFDSSIDRGEPIRFPLGMGRVIPGWDEGIRMMSKGEKGVLYIPYYLAYGEQAMGKDIPAFSNLVFDVELVDFNK